MGTVPKSVTPQAAHGDLAPWQLPTRFGSRAWQDTAFEGFERAWGLVN